MSRHIRLWGSAIASLLLVITACGGSAAPTGPASVPPTSAAVSPGTTAAVPTAAPDPTGVAGPTDGATPATSGSDPGVVIPSDPALLGTGLVPDGWQVIEDETGTCRMAVPSDWATDVLPASAQTSVLVEGLAGVYANTQDWDAFTQTADQIYLTGHVVLIDTADVFLIANPIGPDFDLSYMLGLRFDDVNCQLLTTVQRNWISQYAAPAILIAQTLDHTD